MKIDGLGAIIDSLVHALQWSVFLILTSISQSIPVPQQPSYTSLKVNQRLIVIVSKTRWTAHHKANKVAMVGATCAQFAIRDAQYLLR